MTEFLGANATRFAGRVGFVWCDDDGPAAAEVDLTGQPGVVGQSDRFVTAETRHAALVARLLGRTWIVETLDHALVLAAGWSPAREPRRSDGRRNDDYPAEAGTPTLSFVTLAGDLLQADGTLLS